MASTTVHRMIRTAPTHSHSTDERIVDAVDASGALLGVKIRYGDLCFTVSRQYVPSRGQQMGSGPAS